MADTMANTQKCILVVAMAIFNKLYGTIGERRSNSSSFQPSLSIAASSMSHFFHFALTIDTMTSRNKYLHLWARSWLTKQNNAHSLVCQVLACVSQHEVHVLLDMSDVDYRWNVTTVAWSN